MQENVTFRASPVLLARIDRLAGTRKASRSAAIKAAIVEATVPEHATAIADEREVLALLSEAARGGSVSAMKALLAHHRENRGRADPGDPVTALDELAARRGGGTHPTGGAG